MAGQTVSLGSAGSINVIYDADTDAFEKGTKKVIAGVGVVGKEIADNTVRFAKWGAAASLASIAVGASIFKSQSAVIDKLRMTSDAMGEQQVRLQALISMADQADVSAEGLAGALDFLQRSLGGIKDKGDPANKALERMGLSLDQIKQLAPSAQLEAIAKGLMSIDDVAVRAALRTDLLGRGSKQLTDLMRDLGNDGIDPTVARLERLGIALTRVQSQAVDNAGDAIGRAKEVLDGVSQQAVAAMAPFVEVLANAFVDSATDAGHWGERVGEVLDNVAVGSIKMAAKLRAPMTGLKEALQNIWDGYKQLPDWAQEVGVFGAIAFGKKGALITAGVSWLTNLSNSTAGMIADAMEKDLEMRKAAGESADVIERLSESLAKMRSFASGEKIQGPSILDKLFGDVDGGSSKEWEEKTVKAYREAMARVREQAAAGAAAIKPSAGGGETNFGHSKEDNEKFVQALRDRLRSERDAENASYNEATARLHEMHQQATEEWGDYFTILDKLTDDHEKKLKEIDDKTHAGFMYSPEQNEAYIAGLTERFQSESDIVDEKYEQDLARMNEFQIQMGGLWGDGEQQKTLLAEEHAKRRTAIAEAERAARVALFSNMFDNLSTLMNTKSRALFNIGKAAAIASAVINTAEGATKALAQGGFFGIALAASVVAAGLVQIANIKAQQFGGGGGNVSSGGTTSFSGGLPTQNVSSGGAPAQAKPKQQIGITLVGGNFSAQQVRDLIGQINEQLGDGMQLAAT